MLMVQVVTEVLVDEELIIEQNQDEWESGGFVDVGEFIAYLVGENVITLQDLGEVDGQFVQVL